MNRPIDAGGAGQAAKEFRAPRKKKARIRTIARRGAIGVAVAAALAGGLACASSGQGGSQNPGITRVASGEIHPANNPDLCLSAEPQENGMPPQVGSGIVVVPCGRENPNEIWNIQQEEDSSGLHLIIRLGQTNLALSAQNPPHLREEAVHAQLGVFESGNNPFTHLPAEQSGPFYVINEGGQSRRVLVVPKRPTRHLTYDHALWMKEELAVNSPTEETIFKLPPFATIGIAAS